MRKTLRSALAATNLTFAVLSCSQFSPNAHATSGVPWWRSAESESRVPGRSARRATWSRPGRHEHAGAVTHYQRLNNHDLKRVRQRHVVGADVLRAARVHVDLDELSQNVVHDPGALAVLADRLQARQDGGPHLPHVVHEQLEQHVRKVLLEDGEAEVVVEAGDLLGEDQAVPPLGGLQHALHRVGERRREVALEVLLATQHFDVLDYAAADG
ncbi:XRE family transcriptional regulator [Babesia caballi]|uniref:XRE family transcriptional regulator n=1 Tax=Babesia caballi TaxID=5871 RepID=A0AAV4M067_BABCB|nr:XRE family transcriptional regulator [Babesia caballi]